MNHLESSFTTLAVDIIIRNVDITSGFGLLLVISALQGLVDVLAQDDSITLLARRIYRGLIYYFSVIMECLIEHERKRGAAVPR